MFGNQRRELVVPGKPTPVKPDKPKVRTKLVYAADVTIGMVVATDRVEAVEPQSESVTEGPSIFAVMFAGHRHVDHLATVLDKRESGGMVSLILLDEDGEQQPLICHDIETVRVVDNARDDLSGLGGLS